MKVVEIFQDPKLKFARTFTNIDYMFSIQRARCQEFVDSLELLNQKNPQVEVLKQLPAWVSTISQLASTSVPSISLSSLSSTALKQALEKFPSLKALWNNVISAKQKYEQVGGKYEGI